MFGEAERLLNDPNATEAEKEEALAKVREARERGETNISDVNVTIHGANGTAMGEGPSGSVSGAPQTLTVPMAADGDLTTRGPAKSVYVGAPRMSDNPKSALYHYHKIKQLADGGTCIVFKVQHDSLYGSKSRVFHAAKLLPRSNPKVEETSRRLWTIEANMLKKVKAHPNLLELVCQCVMLPGGPLSSVSISVCVLCLFCYRHSGWD